MIDSIKQMITEDNEVLDILPQNNATNRKKYRAQLSKTLEKYQDKKKEVLDYIVAKNSLLRKKYNIGFENNLINLISDLEYKISYFNPYQTPFEILGLDKLFYGLRKYYDNDLNIYNSNINKILDIFDLVGVHLTKDDFYFNDSSEKYMEVLINERKNGNYNSPLIKETFENLFWKCHNMMRYILLNFTHLYYENEKKFNEYLNKCKKNILVEYDNNFDNLVRKYQELIIKSNDSYLSNKGVFFDKFINKEITCKDYEKEKIEKLVNEYFNNNVVKNPRETFMKLYASLKEELFIYQSKFVLDEVDKLYKEKDSYKNLVSESKKEIANIEKTILKKHKKITSRSIFAKHDKDSILAKEIEDSLQELDQKYEELDTNRFKEKIASMVNPTLKDYYLLGKSYLFMEQITKEMDVDIDILSSNILKNIYSPYNALIENINNGNIETLNLIVYDKYRLLGLYLTTDDFLDNNLEGLINVIGNIIIYYTLIELEIKLEDIDFIIQSDEIIKKESVLAS